MAYFRVGDAVRDRDRGHERAGIAASAAAAPSASAEKAATLARHAVLSSCPELDCLRGRLAPELLQAAELRANALGAGADQVLIAAGAITAEDYARRLAAWLGLGFEPLAQAPREDCPLSATLIQAPVAGLLPLERPHGLTWAVAPQGMAARHLVRQVALHPELRFRLRLTSPQGLSAFVHRHCAGEIGWRAARQLQERHPQLSATSRSARCVSPSSVLAALLLAFVLVLPSETLLATQIAMSVLFLGWSAMRLFAMAMSAPHAPTAVENPNLLPIYTVVVALYREEAAAADLVAALAALDYPVERLDIKFVIEPDDPGTRAALEALRGKLPFEIIAAPDLAPRTKPKALNAALPFARGAFTVVYDAEDRPEPDQLRRALAAFAGGPAELACVQARLTIDNTSDSWLTRIFTAEYAALFDVFLPGLAHLRLPIPLGGSSNHLRTSVLRECGAWDPFNVTEDADLGMRLARQGHITTIIASSTYEEAPADLTRWLKQRARWFKGWLQTWCVHMRSPVRLLRELRLGGFLAFQLVLAGTVLSALVQPFAIALLVLTGAGMLVPAEGGAGYGFTILWWVHATALVSGYATSIVLGIAGLARRRLLASAWALPLFVLYWLLLSAAAWYAVWQLVADPHRWDKTDHGLARTSRRDRAKSYR